MRWNSTKLASVLSMSSTRKAPQRRGSANNLPSSGAGAQVTEPLEDSSDCAGAQVAAAAVAAKAEAAAAQAAGEAAPAVEAAASEGAQPREAAAVEAAAVEPVRRGQRTNPV
jgi:hypothetical protein